MRVGSISIGKSGILVAADHIVNLLRGGGATMALRVSTSTETLLDQPLAFYDA